MPLLSATFTLSINKFRPMGGVFPISASMEPDPKNPPSITIKKKDIEVKGKDPVELIFALPDPQYALLGVAFAANSSSVSVGMHTFPSVLINRQPSGTTMTVTDQPQPTGLQLYDYVILVQSVATGEIGLIDPSVRNKYE